MGALSIIPYYGGKARMAPLISKTLDYSDTETYVEVFGGGARTLLNKPRHREEFYNDYGEGTCALMRVMSNPADADELIHLLTDTEYSEEEFIRQKKIYDFCDKDSEEKAQKAVVDFLIDHEFTRNEAKLLVSYDEITEDHSGRKKVERLIKAGGQAGQEFAQLYKEWHELYERKSQHGYLERPRDLYGSNISDMELAIATYIVFTFSRDGMGEVFSSYKFPDTRAYHKHLTTLYKCAERMEGVHVTQIDAMQYFRNYNNAKRLNDNGIPELLTTWINDTSVMIYADPSYISPDQESKAWDKINWDKVTSTGWISESIDDDPKNLGKLYSASYSYHDHEAFLKAICAAKSRVLISNYDLQLYDYYLTPELGWRKMEYNTFTSVGNKAGNSRAEILWYNF